jgi:predicted secreted acid phosphatase
MRAMDFGDTPEAWAAFVAKGDAPVIEPVREVYRTARRLGVAVIFITSRKEKDRTGTEKNLRAAGVGEYERLILQPDDSKDTSARFKTAARAKLAAEGYVIIANIGDQESDLSGGFAERTFKLPDPFYVIK